METNKKCTTLREQFLELHAPGRGLASAPAVAEHLSTCSECAHVWKSFSETMLLLEEWKAPEPSPFFATRITARLDEIRGEEFAFRQSMWERIEGILFHRRFIGFPTWQPMMAGVVAVVLMIGMNMYQQPVAQPIGIEIQMQTSGVHDLNKLQQNQDVYASMDVLDDLPNSDDMQAPNTGTHKDSTQKDTTEM